MDNLTIKYYIRINWLWVKISSDKIPTDSKDYIARSINWNDPESEYVFYIKEGKQVIAYKIKIGNITVNCCRDIDVPDDYGYGSN